MAAALNLSPTAKELFAIIRSAPGGMNIIAMESALMRDRGDEEIKSAVNELKKKGLIRRKSRGEDNLVIWTAH